jgi:hypothetical protein
MRAAAALALIVSSFWVAAGTEAFADKRVALVIGNASYVNATKLANPLNDATAVSVLLEAAGFKVEIHNDLGNVEMRRVIRDFQDDARDSDIAVVYYAGHGIELDNKNYLIPTDAKLQRDRDVEDETVSVERVMTMIEPARRLRLVILDACRDNPFTRSMTRTMATRAASVSRGLAKYEPTMSNTLIAFAASPGSTVLDGEGSSNSPFTTALVKHITTPNLDLRIAFGNVRDEVLQSTSNRQEPYISGSLGGGTIALVRSTPDGNDLAVAPVPAPAAPTTEAAARDYERAMQVGTVVVWDEYLRTYPTGFYANLARAQRAKVLAAVTPPPAAPPVVAVVPPQTATRTLAPPESSKERKREAKRARSASAGDAGAGGGGSDSGCAAAKRTLAAAMALGFDNRDGVITAVRAKCGR